MTVNTKIAPRGAYCSTDSTRSTYAWEALPAEVDVTNSPPGGFVHRDLTWSFVSLPSSRDIPYRVQQARESCSSYSIVSQIRVRYGFSTLEKFLSTTFFFFMSPYQDLAGTEYFQGQARGLC